MEELQQAILDQLGLLTERIEALTERVEGELQELRDTLDRTIEWYPE